MSPRQLSPGPYFITTAPTLIPCGKCSRPVLAATVGGIDRHVDFTCLTDEGELMALLGGKATYDLRNELLTRRTVERIGGQRSHPVLADHDCTPIPEVHVDHLWDEVGVALARTLLGAEVYLPTNPSF